MSKLDWDDILDIGLPELDNQHKRLLALSNSLIQAMTVGKGKEVLQLLFEEIKGYTAYHFADEERYMRQIGYPHQEEHANIHKEMTQQVDEFREKLLNSKVSADEALDFINNWIVAHIMKEDTKIGLFAKS
ncbi:MAG: hemerythrin family protein [Pseudodesulfovibrio sp.]|nr:hemerythrin family protein [Pseudodesulfovibrio sp.]